MRSLILSLVSLGMLAYVAGCSTEPPTEAKRESLLDEARTTLQSLEAQDPGLANAINNAYAYIVFPDVSKGGLGVGGAFGRGIADLRQRDARMRRHAGRFAVAASAGRARRLCRDGTRSGQYDAGAVRGRRAR